MSLNLIKLCVGVDRVSDLAQWQARRLVDACSRGEEPRLLHITRNTPKRAQEILDGGSLYWVIKRLIRVRQRIVGVEPYESEDGRPGCALVLDPELVRTEIRNFRAFQGWRYFSADDTPRDAPLGVRGGDDFPPEMAAELRGLGLL